MKASERMNVYVLTRAYDYEGERPIGVYATLEAAKAEANRQAAELNWSYDWSELSPKWWELSNGSGEFVIRAEEVRD